MSIQNGEKIGGVLGKVIKVGKIDWTKRVGRMFFRVRIEIDLRKTLIPGFWVL